MTCEPDGVYYSVPQINAPAADGTWGQVWPERLYLIRNGQVMPVTGGYMTYAYMSNFNNTKGTKPVMPTVAEGNTFDITISRYNEDFHGVGCVFFKNRIDLSGYGKIMIEQSTHPGNGGGGWASLSVVNEIKNLYTISTAHELFKPNSAVIETNINLTSTLFVGVEVCRSTSGDVPETYRIANMWLEK